MSHTVLIVEDNFMNKKLFEDILHVHGYQIFSTENGFEALQIALDNTIDVVLMDIQLFEISGLDVIKMFKNNNQLKDIPIIAVTAFAMKDDEQHILEQGASAYLAKPISVVSLLENVRKYTTDNFRNQTYIAGAF
jgi:two-component system, cell cycle response regulator DivK